jgi:hypothetical protein
MGYLMWYNTEKPHRSINKLSHMMYYFNVVVKNKKTLICYGFLHLFALLYNIEYDKS